MEAEIVIALFLGAHFVIRDVIISFIFAASIFVIAYLINTFYLSKQIKTLPDADKVEAVYCFPKYSAPPVQGVMLKIMAIVLEHSILLRYILRKSNKIDKLRNYHIFDEPTFFPVHYGDKSENQEAQPEQLEEILKRNLPGGEEAGEFRYYTINDYKKIYSSKQKTPNDVAEKLIEFLPQARDKLKAVVEWDAEVIRAQAAECTKRYQNGTARILEGIPISVKDQLHVKGYRTCKGRSNLEPLHEDAVIIKRLRDAGAIIFAKVNLTEMGIHVSGLNSNKRYGHCRNPYNPNHQTGGSSSGSGSAVGCGLGPVSIAADGGGSIRIPASFCGQVGVKPTCGLVPLTGDSACFGSTVDVVGPIATSAQDAAVVLKIISGHDLNDPLSIHSPKLSYSHLLDGNIRNLSGLKIGIYDEWFNDASKEVVENCRSALDQFLQQGAELVKIKIPELDLLLAAHVASITSEMYGDVHDDIRFRPSSFTAPTRILFALSGDNKAIDYLQAAKVRTRMLKHFKKVFQQVDLIVTPGAAIAPPKILASLTNSIDESNIEQQGEIMRYVHSPNFTGYPACTFPIAYTKDNLPIALHLIAKPYHEDLLLKLAELSHDFVKRNKPQVFYDLLA